MHSIVATEDGDLFVIGRRSVIGHCIGFCLVFGLFV